MTAYAFLKTDLACPHCAQVLNDEVWFIWGYTVSRAPLPATTYVAGDEVRWRSLANGAVPPWTLFEEAGRITGGNSGSADVRELIVRDLNQTWLNETCTNCGGELGGPAVEIRGGRIRRGWLTARGSFPSQHMYWLFGDGDVLIPQPWDEHTVDIVVV